MHWHLATPNYEGVKMGRVPRFHHENNSFYCQKASLNADVIKAQETFDLFTKVVTYTQNKCYF